VPVISMVVPVVTTLFVVEPATKTLVTAGNTAYAGLAKTTPAAAVTAATVNAWAPRRAKALGSLLIENPPHYRRAKAPPRRLTCQCRCRTLLDGHTAIGGGPVRLSCPVASLAEPTMIIKRFGHIGKGALLECGSLPCRRVKQYLKRAARCSAKRASASGIAARYQVCHRPGLSPVKAAAGGLPVSLTASLSALANLSSGGTLILGLDERSGFRPVRLAEPQTLKQGLAGKARAYTPPVRLSIRASS